MQSEAYQRNENFNWKIFSIFINNLGVPPNTVGTSPRTDRYRAVGTSASLVLLKIQSFPASSKCQVVAKKTGLRLISRYYYFYKILKSQSFSMKNTIDLLFLFFYSPMMLRIVCENQRDQFGFIFIWTRKTSSVCVWFFAIKRWGFEPRLKFTTNKGSEWELLQWKWKRSRYKQARCREQNGPLYVTISFQKCKHLENKRFSFWDNAFVLGEDRVF